MTNQQLIDGLIARMQLDLFPAMEYVDLSHGMTARSTRTKDPKRRKTIALYQSNDRPSTAQTYTQKGLH
jgi:hypothetical protein